MENIFYVYHLIDPLTNEVFYVGKGHGNRIFDHEKEVRRNKIPHKNKHLYFKIKKILSLGRNIIYKKIYENINEECSFKKELEEIRRIGRADLKHGSLCNLTDGGEGQRGIIYTEEMRKFRSELYSGEKNPMFGKNHTDETKKIISNKRRNRVWNFKHTDKHKEKLKSDNPGGKSVSIKVCQLDKNKNLIKIWVSGSSAAKYINCSKGNLFESIKRGWMCKGYYWKLYEY
jgi:group I intron endonuclease